MKISNKFLFAVFLTGFSIYLVFALNPEGASRILLNLLTFAGIYGLSAIGLNVHFGWTGLLNFGHASFMGVGAYVTLLLMPHAAGREGEITSTGLPFIFALIIGILSAALFGLLLGLPAIRLRGDYLAIVTIAAAEIFRLLVRDLESITGGVYGIINYTENLQQYRPNFINNFSESFGFSPSQAWVCLLAWVSIFFTVIFLKRLNNSPWGRALRAVREDEDAVRAMGKNAVWLKLQSFMLGAGIAGLSGVFLAFNYGSLETTVFVPLLTFYVWAIMILGGVGTITGPIFGSIIFWVIISETDRLAFILFENANGQQLAGVRFLLVGLLIMVLMIFRPSGLLGKKEELLLDVNSLIEVKNLKKTFGGITAVDIKELGFNKGELTSIIGPNGAGKTTFFDLISGFQNSDSGDIYLKDKDVSNSQPYKIARMGMVRTFQLTKVFDRMTVLENLLFSGSEVNNDSLIKSVIKSKSQRKYEENLKDKAKNILEELNILHMADSYARELSGGQKKLLELARSIINEPEILLLDEPLAGVNPKLAEDILSLIKKLSNEGITILMVEHNIEAVMKISERIVVLAEGSLIADGNPNEIRTDRNVIEAYLGKDND